jgi:hypothetical protein
MPHVIMLATSLHVLATVFWAGSTMAMAATGGVGRPLFLRQLAAGLVALLTGVYLWHTLHAGEPGPGERFLAAGAACALLALALQALLAGPAIWKISKGASGEGGVRTRILVGYRAAALLLAVAAIAMGAFRYAGS